MTRVYVLWAFKYELLLGRFSRIVLDSHHCPREINHIHNDVVADNVFLTIKPLNLADNISRPWCNGPGDDGDDYAGGQNDHGVIEEISKPKLKKPPMYTVVLLNDDYTPMEFVIEVLQTFFIMNREKATQIMLAVHTEGKGVCGVYTRDVAETKSAQINQYAQECQHPLVSQTEVTD